LSGHDFSHAPKAAKSIRLHRLRKKSKRCHPERSEGSQRLMFATTYANSTPRYMPADRRIGLFSATSLAAEVRLLAPLSTLVPQIPQPAQELPKFPIEYHLTTQYSYDIYRPALSSPRAWRPAPSSPRSSTQKIRRGKDSKPCLAPRPRPLAHAQFALSRQSTRCPHRNLIGNHSD
jgi:hypothetical protein